VNNVERGRIVVVDDTPANLRLLAQILQEQGYIVLPARSGAIALQAIRNDPPDLILLDVKMPEMDGYAVCQQLKAEACTREIPVIFISAMDSVDDKLKGFAVGGVDYISKPFQTAEVLARVQTHLTLYNLQRKLAAQNVQLEGALHLREDLANMIVHDMRSPLAAISSFAYLLKMGITMPKYVQYLDAIRLQADRLNGFLNDMLLLAKMETTELLLNLSRVDLNQLALETLDNHQVLAQARQIDLHAELPPHSPELWLDANLFRRVLDNLISNAVKHSPAGGAIVLHIEPLVAGDDPAASVAVKPAVRLRVLDQGPGIPVEYRERIFDKFEVVDLKNEKYLAIGLGLTFCKLVVEAHGGRIYVEGNVPVGSIFIVEV